MRWNNEEWFRTSSKRHFACMHCRRAWKGGNNICSECRRECRNVGRDCRIPRRGDDAAWAELKRLTIDLHYIFDAPSSEELRCSKHAPENGDAGHTSDLYCARAFGLRHNQSYAGSEKGTCHW